MNCGACRHRLGAETVSATKRVDSKTVGLLKVC